MTADAFVARPVRQLDAGRMTQLAPSLYGSRKTSDGGHMDDALAETMISGNVARMLLDVAAVSTERIDSGSQVLPWARISRLSFS